MSTATPEPMSKLFAKVDNVVLRDQVYQRARHSGDREQEKRECGRLHKSISDLQETAEKCRKATGKAGQP